MTYFMFEARNSLREHALAQSITVTQGQVGRANLVQGLQCACA